MLIAVHFTQAKRVYYGMIEEAIAEAERKGAMVLTLGLLNQVNFSFTQLGILLSVIVSWGAHKNCRKLSVINSPVNLL